MADIMPIFVDLGQHSAKIGPDLIYSGPDLANTTKKLSDVGPKAGHVWPELGKTLTNIDKDWGEFDQHPSNSIGPNFAQFDRN